MVANTLFLAPFVGRACHVTVKQYHALSEVVSDTNPNNPTITRQRLTGLIKRGWVTRVNSGVQGTLAYFALTPAGQAAWDADDAAEQAAGKAS